jgi:hypothetical protein
MVIVIADEPIYLGAVPWPNPFSSLARQKGVEAVTIIQLVNEEAVEGQQEGQDETIMKFPSDVCGDSTVFMNFPIKCALQIWTIGLRQGFIGCLKNIRVNGINAEIANAFLAKMNETNRNGKNEQGFLGTQKYICNVLIYCIFILAISIGCPFSFAANFCRKNPCKNGGKCATLHNTFKCDCANTTFQGTICQQSELEGND